jgi:DNA repair exonuclease SbcCD nuclease subunit
MNGLLLGDLHFGARNSNKAIMNWQKKFFAERFFPVLQELKPDFIVQLGDIFDDHKGPTSAVLDFSHEVFFDPLELYKGNVYALVGNHDSYYRDSINCNALKRIKRIQVISELTVMDSMLMLPWLTEPEYHKLDKYFEDPLIKFTLGHLELNGGMIYPGRLWEKGLDASRLPGKIWSGHFHSPSDNYVGTPYDLTWSEWKDCKRMVMIDTITGKSYDVPCLSENLHVEITELDGTDYSDRIVRTKSHVVAADLKAEEVVFYEESKEESESVVEQLDVRSAFFQVLGNSLAMKLVEESL